MAAALYYNDSSGKPKDYGVHEDLLAQGQKRWQSSEAKEEMMVFAKEELGLSEEVLQATLE